MNAQEYEVLHHLKEAGIGIGKNAMVDIHEFDVDVIKSLEKQRYIKTNPKRTEGMISGLGLIAVTTAAEKRKREATPAPTDSNGLSEWEKQARENLSPTQIEALRMLRDMNADAAGVEVTRQQLNPMTRKSLEKYEMIKVDKHNRVWLLDAGYEKLMAIEASADGALPKPEQLVHESKVRPFTGDVSGLDNADSVVEALTPDPSPSGRGEEVDVLEHCDTCAGCVDHEVLHMLAAKFPAIAKLRQTVLETRRLMDELGIEQK